MFKNLAYNWPLFPPILSSSSSPSSSSWCCLRGCCCCCSFPSWFGLLLDFCCETEHGAAMLSDTLCTARGRAREPVSPNRFGENTIPMIGVTTFGWILWFECCEPCERPNENTKWMGKQMSAFTWMAYFYMPCVYASECVYSVQSGAHISIDMPFFLFYGKTGTMSAIWCDVIHWWCCQYGINALRWYRQQEEKMRSYTNRFPFNLVLENVPVLLHSRLHRLRSNQRVNMQLEWSARRTYAEYWKLHTRLFFSLKFILNRKHKHWSSL